MSETLHTAIIGTQQVYGVRELHSMTMSATFDAGYGEASIDPTTLQFVNDANEEIRNLFAQNPLEAPDFIPKTQGYGIVAAQKYAIDLRTLRLLSRVECEAQVFKLSAPNFEKTASGVLMQSLKDKGVFLPSDFRDVPYVVENRKRALELSVFALQFVQIQKAIFDEIFKLVNIVSDIASGAWFTTIVAAVVALLNLTQTLINLVILVQRMIKLIKDNRELFLPPVRFHKGINWYQYLLRATNYLGLQLEVGADLQYILSQLTLLPSKSDEVGTKTSIAISDLDTNLGTQPNIGDGLLRPNDFGYSFGELIELTKITFNCKTAVKDGVFHLRSKKDVYWKNIPAFNIPDVLIEQALGGSNGFVEYNYDELSSRYLISFAKDQTDKHTLTDVNNRMSEFIYDHAVSNKRKSLLRGIDDIQIPYALCVRKPAYDGIYAGPFKLVTTIINGFQDELEKIYEAFPELEQVALATLEKFGLTDWVQEGALVVENHFFNEPKIVMQGVDGRIPSNFTDFISADALWKKWHSFNCMSVGWKNPSNPSETNQKIIFREVKIPFGILDWQKTIVNSHCFVPGYGQGELLSVKWVNGEDHATCDFFAYKTWAPKLTGVLYKIAPQNIISFLT